MRRQSTEWMESQADRIEMVLASHRVGGRVEGGSIGPRCVTFDLSPAAGTRVRHVAGLAEEIALALGVNQCRVYREGAFVRIEVPRNAAQPVGLPSIVRRLPSLSPTTAVLGLDKLGTPLLVRLSSPQVVHILVAGATGSGKTEVLRALVSSLAYLNPQKDLQLVLVDPKQHGLAPCAHFPHLLAPPAFDSKRAQELLRMLAGEMERRDHAGTGVPRIVVAIDELADLLMAGGETVDHLLTRLVQRGRGAGIHVIAATQKPSASILGPLLRGNFPMRIVGRVVSAGDAHIAAGIGGTGAEKLLGKGDMLAIAGGEVVRFQAARISEGEIQALSYHLLGMRGNPREAGRRAVLPSPAEFLKEAC